MVRVRPSAAKMVRPSAANMTPLKAFVSRRTKDMKHIFWDDMKFTVCATCVFSVFSSYCVVRKFKHMSLPVVMITEKRNGKQVDD